MKRQKTVKRLLALLPAAAVLLLSAAGPVFGAGAAARQNDLRDADIMDPSKKGSLTVYKYDMTAAKEAGVPAGSEFLQRRLEQEIDALYRRIAGELRRENEALRSELEKLRSERGE